MDKIIYRNLSFKINGVCFKVHNQLGRYSREKQYCDLLEEEFKKLRISYIREFKINKTSNIADFLIDNKIILEVKAKKAILREDYYQIQRYLQASYCKLGLLVNFRNRYLKPIRVIRIDTKNKTKFF
jgi:GxxExxY protein